MRALKQPGPVHRERIESVEGHGHALAFMLRAGTSLNQALTQPLLEAGMKSATLTFAGGALGPFSYVMPGPSDGPAHVAYFSAPRSPAGTTRVEIANATFGWRDGAPLVHCHGAWLENDARRGGHVLPHETIVAETTMVRAWALRDVAVEADTDAETNFTLFHPVPATPDEAGVRTIGARIKPNEDITEALEAVARRHGIADAIVRGSLGSLIGARFADGGRVDHHATEVLVRAGHITNGRAELDMIVVDMDGAVHEGRLIRGDNPVCITFELVLEAR